MTDEDTVHLAADGELIKHDPYQPWRPEDTRVVTYVLGYGNEVAADGTRVPPFLRPGQRSAPHARSARAAVVKEFGRILEENATRDKVFFRVRRESK